MEERNGCRQTDRQTEGGTEFSSFYREVYKINKTLNQGCKQLKLLMASMFVGVLEGFVGR